MQTIGELELTGAEAKAYRVQRDVTQVQMAAGLGMTQGRMSHLENSPELKPQSIALLAVFWKLTPQAFVKACKRAAAKGAR